MSLPAVGTHGAEHPLELETAPWRTLSRRSDPGELGPWRLQKSRPIFGPQSRVRRPTTALRREMPLCATVRVRSTLGSVYSLEIRPSSLLSGLAGRQRPTMPILASLSSAIAYWSLLIPGELGHPELVLIIPATLFTCAATLASGGPVRELLRHREATLL